MKPFSPRANRPPAPLALPAFLALAAVAVSLAAVDDSAAVAPEEGREAGSDVAVAVASQEAPGDTVSFAEDLLPIFRAKCAECHGGEDENGEVWEEGGLNLLSYERVMQGSEFGPVVEPGKPDESFLLEQVVVGEMPQEGELLPEEEIEMIRAWIVAGAPNN